MFQKVLYFTIGVVKLEEPNKMDVAEFICPAAAISFLQDICAISDHVVLSSFVEVWVFFQSLQKSSSVHFSINKKNETSILSDNMNKTMTSK